MVREQRPHKFAACIRSQFGFVGRRLSSLRLPLGKRCQPSFDMGPKKETAEEKSLRYQQQSQALSLKADMSVCLAAMKQNPSAISEVKRTLQNLGYIKDGVVMKGELPAGAAASSGDGSKAPPAKAGAKKLAAPSADLSVAPSATPAQASSEMLQTILAGIEPVALGPNGLRGLLKPGQRKIPKNILLELLEFVTDMDEDNIWSSMATVGHVI